MASQYISIENLNFLLKEVHQVQDLFAYPRYEEYDLEGMKLLIDAAKAIADTEFFPYFKEMDEDPVRYESGKVITHPQLKNIIQQVAEGGWIGATSSYEHGGMQMPEMINAAAQLLFQAANNSAQGYVGLTSGAARLITSFGSDELIQTYVPKMYGGLWQGTMALTEPQAGSSLSDITTSATPTDAGHYLISGQKIFISAGDHQACDNFVHLLLARIDGAPVGTRGISMFVVPKFRPEADGTLVYNDVLTAADFQKMGQRGYATTHLVFGDQGDCRGYLVGEPHKGLHYMFQMMNEARLAVGQTAAAVTSAAYYAALQYANERPQGRPVDEKDPGQEPVLIIDHPDVRRMLFTQKAILEGALSLNFECAKLMDLTHVTEGEAQENHHLLLELLTPIMKTYPCEAGIRAVSLGLQVLGGYGYTMDFPLQQYYRDIRIMSIYEGTTGIQSLDLLGRKVNMKGGKSLQLLVAAMGGTIKEAQQYPELVPYAQRLGEEMARFQAVMEHLAGFAAKGELKRYIADATVFMEMAGLIVVAWQWLKQAVVAQQALISGDFSQYPRTFFESKRHTMKFFYTYELSHTLGFAKTLTNTEYLTMPVPEEVFV